MHGKVAVLLVLAVCALLILVFPFGIGAGNSSPSEVVSSFPALHLAPTGTETAPPLNASSASSPAISAAGWINVTAYGSGTAPPPVYGASVVYDPLDNTTVLFGGCYATVCPGNQTWTFAGGVWRNVTIPGDSPPGRSYAGADFDGNMGGILLFGGASPNGNPLNDTWLYSGSHWTNVTYVGPAPSARWAPMMAFDPAPEENGSVLFGGCVTVSLEESCTNDTWVWQGWSGWGRLYTTVNPPALGLGAMAYDPEIGAVVEFGGCSGIFCEGGSNATWELYSGQWWQFLTGPAPSARAEVSMIYDPPVETLLLFGGLNVTADTGLGDTWAFSGTGWASVSTTAAPAARWAYGLTLDPTGTTPLLVGGLANAFFNDTWAYELAPSASFVPRPSVAEATAPVNFLVTVIGGSSPFTATVTFGDGGRMVATSAGSSFTLSHTYALPGDFTATLNITDDVGARTTATSAGVRVGSGIRVGASAGPSPTDVGWPVTFVTNTSSSGASPITFNWSFGDGGNGSGASPSHSYASPGTFVATVNATDAVGSMATSTVEVTVNAVVSLTPSASPVSPNTSAPVAYNAGAVGGTPPLHYAWSFGDSSTGVEPSPLHQYAHNGQYTVAVWVNDSVGDSAHATLLVTVSAVGTASGGASIGGAPTWFWIGLGGLAAVAVIGTLLLRRRSRAPPSP